MAALLTIGQVAEAVGLAPTTLRHYDAIGLVEPTTRRGGQRRYTDRDVHRLRVVTHLRQGGFTLDEIATLLDGDGDWRGVARRKRDELQERIEQLVAATELVDAALACGCEDIEGCGGQGEAVAVHHAGPGPALTDPTRRMVATPRGG